MASRVEITSRYAKAYRKAGKTEKGRVLDEVVSVTGWSRDNARRRLVAAVRRPGAGRAGREAGEEAAVGEVLLRRDQGVAAGVGRVRGAVREVPCGLDADPARRPGAPQRAGVR